MPSAIAAAQSTAAIASLKPSAGRRRRWIVRGAIVGGLIVAAVATSLALRSGSGSNGASSARSHPPPTGDPARSPATQQASGDVAVSSTDAGTEAVDPTADCGTLLHVGCQTELVRQLQLLLAEAGFYSDDIDSDFGPKTKEALIAFQRSNDLELDGTIEPSLEEWTTLVLKAKEKPTTSASATSSTTLTTVSNPTIVPVPNVVRKTESQARALLTADGFGIGTIYHDVPFGSIDASVVTAQDPDPLTPLAKGRTVTITVGRLVRTIPSVAVTRTT